MSDRPRRLGRPPVLSESERIAAILDAAERTFTERGYAATTMDRIAATAQMSKRSLYLHFTDKMDLMHALLARSRADVAIAAMEVRDARLPPRDRLRAWLLDMAEFVMQPSQVNLFRLAIAESNANTEVSRAFYDAAMGGLMAALVQGLDRMRQDGEIRCAETTQLAEILLGGTFGCSALREMMQSGSISAPPLGEVGARVDLMLDMIGPAIGFAPARS